MVYTLLQYSLHFYSISSSPMQSLQSPCLPYPYSCPIPLPLHIPVPSPLTYLPHNLKTQSVLIQPALRDPQYHPTLCLREKFQNRSRCNVLCGCILASGDICLHILQYYLPYSLLQIWVFTVPILPEPWLFNQYSPLHPVVEFLYHPPNALGHDPRLCAKDQDGLHHYKLETTQRPRIHNFKPKDLQ